ncbi:MAG: type II secretion system protein GspG [Patescibacteria group bacterium]|nr:type II secretion system protein GspG [Patescibacteria group bacterium]
MKSLKSFTLIELLLVIIILGILATFITSNFFSSLKKGRDARRKSDLEQIRKALELYYEDKRAYPTPNGQNGFIFGEQFADTQNDKIYMMKVPNDPSSGNYFYESNINGTYYKLYACLENDQQILPYTTNPQNFNCNRYCKDNNGNSVKCIWGISSPNTNP